MAPHAPQDRWDVVYARCFANQPEGHALYKPLTTKELKPGSCGYFDHDKDWQSIVDLSDPVALTQGEYDNVPGLSFRHKTGERWHFRKSENVYRIQPGISASVETPLLLAGGGVVARYGTSKNEGAVLLTDGPVTHAQVTPSASLCEWMAGNAKKLLTDNRDAKGRGIWIVTKSYSVKKRALAVMRSAEDEIEFALSANAAVVRSVEASVAWWKSSKGACWNEFDDPDGVVVAFQGVHWRDHWYSRTCKTVVKHQPKYLHGRSGDMSLVPIELDMHSEDVAVELVPEIWGDVDGITLHQNAISSDESNPSDDEL